MDTLLKNQKPIKRQNPPIFAGNQKTSKSPRWVDQVIDHLKHGFSFLNTLRYHPLALKIGGLACLGAFLFGMGYAVPLVISAPDLPPEHVVSTLEAAADYYPNPENSSIASAMVIPGEAEQWVGRSVMGAEDDQTGAGTQVDNRTRDIEYRIRPGETLSEIAYTYHIPYGVLASYNNIVNVNRIQVGTVITIPSLENLKMAEAQFAKRPRTTAAPTHVSAKYVKIDYETRNNGDIDGSGVTVQFFIVDPSPDELQSFEWDFGDGKRGFRPNPSYEYGAPKTYVARLTARDASGNIYKSSPLYVDIPHHPGARMEERTTKFVTLSGPDAYFAVKGPIIDVARYPNVDAAPLDFSESDQFLTKVRFEKPGFYGITVQEGNNSRQYYSVFVSPIPTMHADASEENINWYRTQYNTGTTSNCGPASASMAISWGLGKYFPVSAVRQAVGWRGDGGTSFEELIKVIKNEGVSASIQPLGSVQHIMDVIDSGSIAIIVFRTDGVKTSRLDPATNLFGKYYNDSGGHYIVVKGYSLNGEYLVIHDPIPSDWGTNSFRYGDEISMIGRNRYYLAAELLKSLRRPDMIVVPRHHY
ncbi:MAG: LysM peptidoglycan-binding domain-containing protein [Treponema sp.]|nr:LysM peptidoglycan-binding domain-containing protein [Treponema sp.]